MNNLIMGVKSRCAVNLERLQLPISNEEALEILQEQGFRRIDVDIESLARSLVGTAQFRRSAHLSELPAIVNCSLMIKWLYAQKGIWIPRYAIEQRSYLSIQVDSVDAKVGDLLFRQGIHGLYLSDPDDAVGHVGIVTSRRTVIHATSKEKGVIESDLDGFSENRGRGIRRFPDFAKLTTFECPRNRMVECSSSFRWIILQNL